MIGQLESIGKAEAVFAEMVEFVRNAIASGTLRADEVERSLFDKGLTVGLHLLEAFVAAAGDGDHGETVEREGKTLHRSDVKKPKPYFTNNRQYMKYDEYLAAGYPIGTGVVEGACRHFVKDRMELAGMRWEIEGAQAVLSLRALHLNDQWDDFFEYRIHTEQECLYGHAA